MIGAPTRLEHEIHGSLLVDALLGGEDDPQAVDGRVHGL